MTDWIAFHQFRALFGQLQIFRNDNFVVNNLKLALMGVGGVFDKTQKQKAKSPSIQRNTPRRVNRLTLVFTSFSFI
jgi:hypothetical protein